MLRFSRKHTCRVTEEATSLRIECPWWSWSVGPVGVACAGPTLASFFATIGASSFLPGPPEEKPTSIGALVCFTFAAMACYTAAAMWANRTVLYVQEGHVTVSNTPLFFPWFAPKEATVSDFDQLFVKAVEIGHKRVSHRNSGGHHRFPHFHSERDRISRSITYGVHAICRSGTVELLNLGPDYDTAADIEEHIEAFLGVEDREVPGEV